MSKIFFWVGTIISSIVLILLLFNEPWRDRGCFLNEFVYEDFFAGEVVEKYINYEYSAAPTLILKSEEEVPLIKRGYYEKISIGDSIVKIKNSFSLEIHKDEHIINMTYKYLCDEDI
jgi:hypothetical protein